MAPVAERRSLGDKRRDRKLWAILPGRDGRRNHLFSVDRPGHARAALRHDEVQRSSARRAPYVADTAIEATSAIGGRRSDHREQGGGRRDGIQAYGGWRGPA